MSIRHATGHATAAALLALLVGFALLAAPAAAQQEAPPMPEPGASQESFSEEKLEAFADAAVEVQGVIAEMQPRIAEAENEQEGQELMNEANQEIRSTIEDQPGISFDEYRRIAMRAGQDPELKQRLDGMVRERMERKAAE